MLTLVAALLLAATPLSLSAPTASDPCAVVSLKKNQSTVSEIASCYDSFPFDQSIGKKTFRAISNILEAYAFTDIINNTPDPTYQPNVDVFGHLEDIADSSVSSDRELQEKIQDVFIQLNDGHTSYAPLCYAQHTFLQPLFMIPIHSDEINGPKVILYSYDPKLPQSSPLQLQKYLGAEVVKIDGEPAIKTLQYFADTKFGSSKDPNTRFTQTLSYKVWDDTKKSFRITRGAFSSRLRLPERDSVTYELKLPSGGETVTLTIPWFVKPVDDSHSWSDSASYWNEICARPDQSKSEEGAEREVAVIPAEERLKEEPVFQLKPHQHVSPQALKSPMKSNEDVSPVVKDPTPLVVGQGFAFFLLPNGNINIGVLKMTSFSAPTPMWINAMKKGFAMLKDKKAEKIILDFSDNGGGVACTTYAMLNLISPEVKPFYTDIRLGGVLREVASKVSDNNIFSGAHWINVATNKPFEGSGLIDPPRFKQIKNGNVSKVPYSNLFRDNCNYDWGDDVKKIFPWDLSNVIFFTNGMCGSSCALFDNHIREQTPALRSVVSSSAPKNAVVTSSSFPGQIYRASFLASDILEAGMSKKMDVTIPETGDFYFAFRETYSHANSDEVLEFKRAAADARVYYNERNVIDIQQLWLDVASTFWKSG